MVRVGLAGAISEDGDMRVVGQARDGQGAFEMFEELSPDVTLMDGMLPDLHGVEVTRRLVAAHPEARILLVSINETVEDIHRAMEAGAWGYLPKSSEQSELLQAIRVIASGQRYLREDLARKLALRRLTNPLSDREIQVLTLVAKGRTNKEIASAMVQTEGTVKSYLKQIFAKLDAPDRTRAVTLALEQGVLRL